MVMRVQVVDGEYRLVVPPEAVTEFKLQDGLEVEVVMNCRDMRRPRYVSAEEAVASYLRTEPLHHDTYTELAK